MIYRARCIVLAAALAGVFTLAGCKEEAAPAPPLVRKPVKFATPAEVLAEMERRLQAQGTELPDEGGATEYLIGHVARLVHAGRFEEVEELAVLLRPVERRWPSGWPMIGSLYGGVSRYSGGNWERTVEHFGKWLKARPESVVARVGLADKWATYAWEARGSGWAHTVTPSGWLGFAARLKEARKLLVEAEKISDKEPQLYCVRLTVALGEGWSRAEMETAFEKAVALDAHYYDVYGRKGNYLLAKWHGQPGDWQKFAETAPAKHQAAAGDALFARIVVAVNQFAANEVFLDTTAGATAGGISAQRLKQGFRDLEKQFPRSSVNLSRAVTFAMKMRDREWAREMITKLGSRWDSSAVDNIWVLDAWRQWATAPSESPDLPLLAEFRHPAAGSIKAVEFSPDGKLLAAACAEGKIALWQTSDFKPERVLTMQAEQVSCVRFSPDGKLLAAGTGSEFSQSPKFQLQVWSTATWKPVHAHPLEGMVLGVAFAHDSGGLVTAGGRYQGYGQTATVELPAFKPDVNKWDGPTPSVCVNILANKSIVWGWGAGMVVLDSATTNYHKNFDKPLHSQPITAIALSADQSVLALVSAPCWEDRNSPGQFTLWNTRTWEKLPVNFPVQKPAALCAVMTPSGKHLLTAGTDHAITVWDATTGTRKAVLVGHADRIFGLAITKDGKRLASGGYDHHIRIWDISKLE